MECKIVEDIANGSPVVAQNFVNDPMFSRVSA